MRETIDFESGYLFNSLVHHPSHLYTSMVSTGTFKVLHLKRPLKLPLRFPCKGCTVALQILGDSIINKHHTFRKQQWG
jgi:hypothetical protein